MSRIGNKPISIPAGVKVEQSGRQVKVSGPLGTMELDCPEPIKVKVDGGTMKVENEHSEIRTNKQLHGTTRAILANVVEGVTKGYEKKIEIYGTGYTVKEQGGKLVLQVGFAHSVELPIPKGLKVKIDVGATKGNETPAKFTISGVDKCLLGGFSSNIRKVKPPEPYQGKGIRYADEHVKRKVGKTFTSGTA